MKTVEYPEDPFGVLSFDADSVVLNTHLPAARKALSRDVYPRVLVGPELDRVCHAAAEFRCQRRRITRMGTFLKAGVLLRGSRAVEVRQLASG